MALSGEFGRMGFCARVCSRWRVTAPRGLELAAQHASAPRLLPSTPASAQFRQA